MGLAQNLKRMLKNLERKILVEPFSHYIRRQEELILRKRDSYSSMGSSQNHLTQGNQRSTIATSSQGTSERTTMKKTEDLVDNTVKWAKNRIDEMDCVDQIYDKLSIVDEFHEWLNMDLEGQEIIIIDRISEEQYNDYVDYMNDGIS